MKFVVSIILWLVILGGCAASTVPAPIIDAPTVIITPSIAAIVEQTTTSPESTPVATLQPTPTPIMQFSQVFTNFLGLRAPTLAWSPDSKTLAWAGRQRNVRLWSMESNETLDAAIYTYVSSLAWGADGVVYVAGHDATAWRVTADGDIQLFEGHANAVFAVAANPTSDVLVTVSSDKRLRWWNREGDELVVQINTAPLWNAVWNPAGDVLATSDGDYAVKLWSVAGDIKSTLNGHTDDPTLLAWNGDGSILASAGFDGSVRLWSAAGQPLQTWTSELPIVGIAWHPNNQQLAWLDAAGVMRQEPIQATTSASVQPVFSQPLAWSPDGQWLAVAQISGLVEIYDQAGEMRQVLEGHTAQVVAVAWSPDAQWLASASADGTIRLWRTL